MNQSWWLESCARRLTELDAAIDELTASQIAIRIWFLGFRNRAIGGAEQGVHPVAAAEAWHRGCV